MSANIFPPILDSYQPAFINTAQNYPIYFELSGLTNINSVKNIQIKLVYQETNQSAVDTSRWPDDIIYYDSSVIAFDQSTNKYFVNINNSDIDSGMWKSGIYYRVQLRFGLGELFSSLNDFFTWKKDQVKLGNFSEWSTAMVLRPISQPTIQIINNQVFSSGLIVDSVNTETSYTPTFFGIYSCITYEPVDKYKFNLYDYDGGLLETSGWLQYNASDNVPISGEETIYSCALQYRFKTVLTNQNNQTYGVNFEIITRNLYEGMSNQYKFDIDVNPIPYNNYFKITCYDSKNEPPSQLGRCDNEGVIDIYLDSKGQKVIGNYVLVRSDEHSNFQIWEDLTYLTFSGGEVTNWLAYSDYTIESGINYRYGIQYQNAAGLRSELVVEEGPTNRQSNFNYSYLYNKDLQLKLKFDNTITSYKKTVLVSKQDTLGSRYPTILRNGEAYYQEFTMSGLISLKMDDFQTFFQYDEEKGYFFRGEEIIPVNKYREAYEEKQVFGHEKHGGHVWTEGKSLVTFDHNLTHNNRFMERIFREKVEEFLVDTNPKLYKSATEGNFIVALTNVSMVPKTELNRMLYSFTATAYEIMEYSLDNLKAFDMVPFNEFQPEITKDNDTFGQISGFFQGEYSRDSENGQEILYPNPTTPDNLVSIIAAQVATQVTTVPGQDEDKQNYQRLITSIESIWVETYPKLDFSLQLIELDALIAEEKNKGEDADLEKINDLEKQKADIEILREETEQSGKFPYYTLVINGQEIQMGENRVYHLDNLHMSSLTDIHMKYSGAIVLNYTCKTSTIENPTEIEYGRATVSVWNQIAGMFTESEDILINYNQDLNIGIDTLPAEEDLIPDYAVHNFEEHNIGVYETLSILDVIKEKAIKEIEKTQNIVFTDKGVNIAGEEEWNDGQFYYTFGRITSISIEGEPGTPIIIQSYAEEDNQPDAQNIHYIGSTNKLIIKEIDDRLIRDIRLKDPQYVIVDFTADVALTVKGQQTNSEQEAATLGLLAR